MKQLLFYLNINILVILLATTCNKDVLCKTFSKNLIRYIILRLTFKTLNILKIFVHVYAYLHTYITF